MLQCVLFYFAGYFRCIAYFSILLCTFVALCDLYGTVYFGYSVYFCILWCTSVALCDLYGTVYFNYSVYFCTVTGEAGCREHDCHVQHGVVT